MTPDNEAAIHKRPCPECGAHQHQPCWSRYLHAPMTNEIHKQRRFPP